MPAKFSTLKMDTETEEYVVNCITEKQPVELIIILACSSRAPICPEWHQASDAQMQWERQGNKGIYNQEEYDAAFEAQSKLTLLFQQAQDINSQTELLPIIERLGGEVLSSHRVDPADQSDYYGEVKIKFVSANVVSAVTELAAHRLVDKITTKSERAWENTFVQMGEEMDAWEAFRPFTSRLETPSSPRLDFLQPGDPAQGGEQPGP
jgi:hypothetical protein